MKARERWDSEDEQLWKETRKRIANRNPSISIPSPSFAFVPHFVTCAGSMGVTRPGETLKVPVEDCHE